MLADRASEHWLDLGCGSGVFTEVLSHFLQEGSRITSIDKVAISLPEKVNNVDITFLKGDFIHDSFNLPSVNGILIANALHYVKDKASFIRKWEPYFIGRKQWLVVEYDHTIPNQWEPYPLNFKKLQKLFTNLGYTHIERIGELPSTYGGHMYAAMINEFK